MKIAISAGHGLGSRVAGKIDPGAVGNGYKEYSVVLGMAKRLGNDYAALGWQTLVRDQGYFSSADDDAAKWGADLFLELHLNAAANPSAHGVECLVGKNPSAHEARWAKALCSGVSNVSGITNRGVKVRSDLAVLRQWGMHSVLLELAFVTSTSDMKKFQASVDAIELAIVNATLASIGRRPASMLPRKWSKPRRLWARITYR